MKITKCTSLFLAILLLVSNLGLAFNVHYCGDEVASVTIKSVVENTNPIDECCGISEKKTQCCNDKVVQVQEKSDTVILKSIIFQTETVLQTAIDLNSIVPFEVPNFKSKSIIAYFCDDHAPPIYKLYSQYIFYA